MSDSNHNNAMKWNTLQEMLNIKRWVVFDLILNTQGTSDALEKRIAQKNWVNIEYSE